MPRLRRRRRGDRRVGTEHILLAVLHDPAIAASVGGRPRHGAARTLAALDRAALAAVGLGDLPDAPPITRPERGWLPISPAAKTVLTESLEESGHAQRGPGYVLLALLRLERPDAAAVAAGRAWGLDRAAVRGRLALL